MDLQIKGASRDESVVQNRNTKARERKTTKGMTSKLMDLREDVRAKNTS